MQEGPKKEFIAKILTLLNALGSALWTASGEALDGTNNCTSLNMYGVVDGEIRAVFLRFR